jgi:hypothetical protein
MEAVTISQITEGLRKLPAEQLAVVYDFITFLAERDSYGKMLRDAGQSYAIDTMLASEAVLRRDWDSPEEDQAWENL